MNHWPTCVEINLSNIRHNVRRIKEKIGPDVSLMVVVKANAYGHGDWQVGKAVLEAGAEKLGVACVDEAVRLREHGITCPILIVGYSFPDAIADIVKYDVMPALFDLEWAKLLSEEAQRQGKTAAVNVLVNTGMNRYGIEPEEAVDFLTALQQLPNLEVEGIFTHLATAYGEREYTGWQFRRFAGMLEELDAHGIHVPYRHCANTGAVLNMPETFLNQVRLGLLATTPFPALDPKDDMGLRESFAMKSKVAFVRQLKAGEAVGYDRMYACDVPAKMAVVSAGWGDGIPRELSNKGYVLIHGTRCPMRGRVMSDQVFADITHLQEEVRVGDEAVIIGSQGEETISCWEWSRIMGSPSSPVTLRSHIGPRVEIRYIED